jgi:hypothetical protein
MFGLEKYVQIDLTFAILVSIFIIRGNRQDSFWYRSLICECKKNDRVFMGLGFVEFSFFILVSCFSY